jgi:hypothetical protein
LLTVSHALAADDDDIVSTNRDRRPIEELFKTDEVYPEEKGELEVGLSSVYQNHAGGADWTVPLEMEYGLTDRLQLEAEWDSLVQRFPAHRPAVRGIGDLELGAQYSFMDIAGTGLHIAPRFAVEAPAGNVNRDLGDGFLEYEPAIIVAKDFPALHNSQVFTEFGPGIVQRIRRPADADDAEPSAHELNWSSGFFVLFGRAAATMEFNWSNNTWNHHGTENEMYLTPGALWRVRPSVELGLGIPVGLNQSSDHFEVIAHVVWEF